MTRRETSHEPAHFKASAILPYQAEYMWSGYAVEEASNFAEARVSLAILCCREKEEAVGQS